ncbi:oxidoreductase [Planotetraspora thailandica]|uniref:Oxidoreductase n=1 Tax=Planotetraspora thailandica TaxID=487172 RepID=A0A8J3V3S0_9ACTN|nr:(2Fe-2S)-binding protein [Planotetraspora thailandica]GII56878.1 oxidoreductase [Planotetraspora thailandica]
MTQAFELTVNGRPVRVETHPDTSLLHVLRNELDLKGTRFGCGLGLCGACFVRMDGDVVPSCDVPMWSAAGRDVVTVEGLAPGDELHPVQEALLEEQAAQCGFCISGIAVSAATLLESTPAPDEKTVVRALDRNLCRCGVQQRVVRAVLKAASSPGVPGESRGRRPSAQEEPPGDETGDETADSGERVNAEASS